MLEQKLIQDNEVYKRIFNFSQQDVIDFARITGDDNPIHLDADFAAKTPFKRNIMHGFLSGACFSTVLGRYFPGEGTIYMSQSMKFLKPMFVDTDYEVVFTVLSIDRVKHRATFKTEIFDVSTNKVTLTGEASAMNTTRI